MKTYNDGQRLYGVSFPATSRPSIKANHIDGPLLTFRDGQMHWLTPWERLLFALGLTDAKKLEQKRRPNLLRNIERGRA